MSTRRPVPPVLAVLLVAVLVVLAGCGSDSGSSSSTGGGKELVGTFRLTAGRCTGTAVTGTYFRMINPGGTIKDGKFFGNPDSRCPDKSFTVQAPGTDGGLVTGTFQPGTGKAFDATGNARASQIVEPGSFTAIEFGISTQKVDPQSRKKVAAPRITVRNGRLSGQITAWSAAWNNLYFNQGSPKPDGSRPGLTSPVSGTYDAKTGAFVLTWASQVVGGPFNGFTGYWHLAGTFTPSR
ncbi:MAG: hypothetical protein ACJ72D_10125 [Marmoricola sp.]